MPRTKRRLLVVTLGLATAACATGGIGTVLSPTVTGTLTIAHESGEITSIQPTECVSGDHGHFLGADLQDKKNATRIRVVMDPVSGPFVRILIESEKARSSYLLDSMSCSDLRAKVEDSDWRINDYRAVVGEIEVDCPLPGDGRVSGRLTFRQCP